MTYTAIRSGSGTAFPSDEDAGLVALFVNNTEDPEADGYGLATPAEARAFAAAINKAADEAERLVDPAWSIQAVLTSTDPNFQPSWVEQSPGPIARRLAAAGYRLVKDGAE